ncbi:MAG: translation initiation factor 2 [Pseudomonadota bacterium]
MKPAFALDFRDETISLLHRSGGGWQLVGAVPLDTPDLTEALGYLRATALGLSPRGMTTKLVIPNEQILYLTVHAPGPDEATRHAQVVAALEGRTPYDVADLAFDYTGSGPEVQVAVIAKETLAEAEGFAAEHRLNPIAFVAAPDPDSFAAEPWFGLSAMAPSLMPPGAKVERDSAPVMIVARSFGPAAQAVEAVVEAPPEVVAPIAKITAEPEVVVEPEVVAAALAAPETVVEFEAAIAADDQPAPEISPEPEDLLAANPVFEPEAYGAAPEDVRPAAVAPEETWLPAAYPARARYEDDTPPAGSLDDDNALIAALADTLSSPIAQPAHPPPAPRKPLVEVEEAPMALDVSDDAAEADEVEPQGADVIRAAISARAARVTDPAIADDLPPMPPPAALGAFSSRRQGDEPPPNKAPALGAAKAGIQRPAAAKPLAAVQGLGASRAQVTKPDLAVKSAKPGKAGLRGLSALVTGPDAAAKPRSKVAIPSALPPLKSADATGAPKPQASRPAAARGPGGFAAREPVRGKPRYLGLLLTVVLLFLLAMIAAWSSYSLGAWNTGTDEPMQVGADNPDGTDVPAAEMPDANDEMLADMQDPAELSDTASASDPTVPMVDDTVASPDAADLSGPSAEPAPALDVATETTAPVNPTAGTDDEIFLASMDAAPLPPDPLSLEQPLAQGDQMPAAQPAPPPFGTVYQFEANGAITPTPEGIITPEGVFLRAGKPPRVPTARTEAVIAAAAKPAVADAALPGAAASAVTTPAVFADPALAGKKPKTRPEGLTPPAAADQGALTPAVDSRLAGLRPTARPASVLSAGRQAQQASAAASLAAQAEGLNQEAALNGGSKLAVAISRKPAARPRDLSRAVEAAVAAVAREPQPEPEAAPEPAPQLAAIPEKNSSAEADGEPDVVSAAPKIPTKATVAKQATFKNAINLSKLNLIGVYGTQSKRYALVRTAAGRYKKVRVGDTIDGGGRVAAITATEVRYQKGGRLVALAMPKG